MVFSSGAPPSSQKSPLTIHNARTSRALRQMLPSTGSLSPQTSTATVSRPAATASYHRHLATPTSPTLASVTPPTSASVSSSSIFPSTSKPPSSSITVSPISTRTTVAMSRVSTLTSSRENTSVPTLSTTVTATHSAPPASSETSPSILVDSSPTPYSMVCFHTLSHFPEAQLSTWRTDTFYTPTLQNSNDSSEPQPYPFSEKGIAWDGERRKYVADPTKTGNGYSSYSAIMPPPNWRLRFPQGYNETNMPNLQEDEHFQNWMRTAGLPSFTKLYGRNDVDTMQSGTYQIVIGLSASQGFFFPISLTVIHSRLPRLVLQGYKVLCHFHCVLDRWQESFPRLGICCLISALYPHRHPRHGTSFN